MTDCVHSELQDVFRNIFDDDNLVVTDETTAADVKGWDSMGNINLIIAIEKHFNVKFTARELGALHEADQNVGNLVAMLVAKIAQMKGSA